MEDSNYEKVFQEFQKRFLKKNIDAVSYTHLRAHET